MHPLSDAIVGWGERDEDGSAATPPSPRSRRTGLWDRPVKGTRADSMHSSIDRQPVRGDFALRLLQAQPPTAHLIVQVVFHLVLLMESRGGTGALRPEIGDGVRPSELEADQVIDLILIGSV